MRPIGAVGQQINCPLSLVCAGCGDYGALALQQCPRRTTSSPKGYPRWAARRPQRGRQAQWST